MPRKAVKYKNQISRGSIEWEAEKNNILFINFSYITEGTVIQNPVKHRLR